MTLFTRLLLLILVAPLLLVAFYPLPLFAQESLPDFSAESLSDQYGIQLSWREMLEVDHVEIQRSNNGETAWETWAEPSGDQFVDTLVACSQAYYYRARTVSAAGENGPWSDVVNAIVAPCAPITVSVYAEPGWYILDVIWRDIATAETHFWLERSADGASWSESAELPPNSGYYADRFGTPECSTTFFYRLRTERDDLFSPYTSIFSDTVSPCAPTAASGVLLTNGERVRLNWRDGAPDETGFEVWRRSNLNPTSQLVATLPAVEATGAPVTWEDDSPDCQVLNYYQIRAIRGTNSTSPWEPRSPNELKVYVPNCPEPASTPIAELSIHLCPGSKQGSVTSDQCKVVRNDGQLTDY